MKKHLLIASIIALLTWTSLWAAQDQDGFTTQQKEEIEQIIHNYLVEKNPQVLIEATQVLQEQEQGEMLANIQSSIVTYADSLFNSDSPILGNGDGNVGIVEFFDYQCIYCKQVVSTIGELKDEDENLMIILKEFPIFGDESEFASKAALAARDQDRYFEFHEALMQVQGRFDEGTVLGVAKEIGLDIEKLQTDMQKPEIEQEIADNLMLANILGIMGTPTFIIANLPTDDDMQIRFIPGTASMEELQNAVKEVRS
ncbi:MAG: DsbA family protein [Gammaproteobacteria bacterium]